MEENNKSDILDVVPMPISLVVTTHVVHPTTVFTQGEKLEKLNKIEFK